LSSFHQIKELPTSIWKTKIVKICHEISILRFDEKYCV
jgi:hypothetical protein